MDEQLSTTRSRRLMKALIQEYIQTGEPVGSRRLSKLSEEGLSAATIRNMMADLEGEGFVCQPHPSAGRVPTEKGYRFYVDVLLEKSSLSGQDISEINRTLQDGDPSVEDLMTRASRVLSSASNNVGFVITPPMSQMGLRHAEFLRLGKRKVLVILVGQSGTVQNRVAQLDDDMTQQELDFAGRYIVTNFYGLTLPHIRRKLLHLMTEEKALYNTMLQKVIKVGTAGLGDEEKEAEGNVYVEGTARLMRNPEFTDVKHMIEIFEMFEQKSHLVKIISECIRDDVAGTKVTIGLESSAPGTNNFAMVVSPYTNGDQSVGSLGILGPKRMEYARAIPLVDYVAKVFEGILNKN